MSVSRRRFLQATSAAGAVTMMPHLTWAERVLTAAIDDPTPATAAPHTLTPVPIQDVVIDDPFWSPKRKVWQEVTIRDCFRKFESDRGGAINNFDKVAEGKLGGHAGDPWMDGLIYEMIRGASDFLIAHPDPELEKQLDGYVQRIVKAAQKSPIGYVNTYTQLVEPGHEWGLHGGFQLWQHEIYNLGALVDAGIHYYRATGKADLLSAGVKISNSMYDFMGPAPKKNLVPCHPLPEEAMVRLYELFEEQPRLKAKISVPVYPDHYLSLAEFWIKARGHNIGKPDWDSNPRAAEEFVRNQEYGDGRPSWGVYAQDDVPVFQQKVIAGHAVRATLLCAGLSATARVNNDPRYREASVRLWEDMVDKRMHITGGVGAFAEQEKFGPDYVLPNDAYLETCAAVGAGFFHHNMNMAFGDARYVDELERTLYNGALSGVSLKGDTYNYQNPLEADTKRSRWVWHECPCCPPMFLKFMGALPSYIYATDANSVYVNLFIGSRAEIPLNGGKVVLKQSTEYPWDTTTRIVTESVPDQPFDLMIRIPGWSRDQKLTVNGEKVAIDNQVRGYARISRKFKPGDVIELTLAMPVQQIRANPLVQADAGRVALMRGPVVYCVESADNGLMARNLSLSDPKLKASFRKDLLDGVIVIEGEALTPKPAQSLYSSVGEKPTGEQVALTAIPFYANGNRGPVEMAVWLPIQA